ncbi:tyrosine-type recombinase/integrase [Streptomyces lasalocidi]
MALDSATFALMTAWRDVQKAQREEWERKYKEDPKKYGPYVDSGYVFTQADGRPWHPDNVSQAFERLIKRLGLPPVRLHDLRHCAASLSLAAGLSMKAIQALLGHASYSLTADTYTSLMPQFEKEAADAPVDLVPRKGGSGTATQLPPRRLRRRSRRRPPPTTPRKRPLRSAGGCTSSGPTRTGTAAAVTKASPRVTSPHCPRTHENSPSGNHPGGAVRYIWPGQAACPRQDSNLRHPL